VPICPLEVLQPVRYVPAPHALHWLSRHVVSASRIHAVAIDFPVEHEAHVAQSVRYPGPDAYVPGEQSTHVPPDRPRHPLRDCPVAQLPHAWHDPCLGLRAQECQLHTLARETGRSKGSPATHWFRCHIPGGTGRLHRTRAAWPSTACIPYLHRMSRPGINTALRCKLWRAEGELEVVANSHHPHSHRTASCFLSDHHAARQSRPSMHAAGAPPAAVPQRCMASWLQTLLWNPLSREQTPLSSPPRQSQIPCTDSSSQGPTLVS